MNKRRRRVSGSAMAEYLVLTGVVTIPVMLALVAAGVSLAEKHEQMQSDIATPYP